MAAIQLKQMVVPNFLDGSNAMGIGLTRVTCLSSFWFRDAGQLMSILPQLNVRTTRSLGLSSTDRRSNTAEALKSPLHHVAIESQTGA